jgi:hypothetical protein
MGIYILFGATVESPAFIICEFALLVKGGKEDV